MKKSFGLAGSLGKIAVIFVVAGGVAIFAYQAFQTTSTKGVGGFVEPASLSPLASAGKVLFEVNCARCHGQQGKGTDHGPPFVNDIYNPGHHPDVAFVLAARNGVRAHHWNFGNMPPIKGITDADMAAIVKYVREFQEANGIVYKPHVM